MKKKGGFVGKDEAGAHVPQRKAALFRVEAGEGFEWSIPSDCPIRRKDDSAIVGFTTSSAHGGVTGSCVALGYAKICVYMHPFSFS